MTVQFRASATTSVTSSSPASVSKPAGAAEGDMLLLHVSLTDDIEPGAPDGFTLVDGITGTDSIRIYAKTAGGSEPSSYSVTFASGSCRLAISAYQSGAGRTIIVDAHDKQSNASGDRIFPSISTDHYDFLLACFATVHSNVATTAPSGMANRYDTGSTSTTIRNYLTTQSIAPSGATGAKTGTGTSAASKCISIILAETPQNIRLSGISTATIAALVADPFTISKPSGVASGDIMLLVVGMASSGTVTGVSGTWTALEDISGVADNISVFYRIAGESEPASYDITRSVASSSSAGIVAFRSLDGHDFLIASAKQDNTVSDTSHGFPSVNSPAINGQLICLAVLSTPATITPDAAMIARVSLGPSGHHTYVMSEELTAAGATGTRAATTSVSMTSRVVTVAIAEDIPPGDDPPDAAPSDLVATAISHQRIDLAWSDDSTNETGFKIQRSLDEEDWTLIHTTGADVETYSDTGLSPNTLYYYRVAATNADGDSDYSNTASDTTDAAPPGPTPPSNLNATAVNHRRVDLTWQDNSDDETGFKVERKQNDTWNVIAVTNANVTFYSDTGLKPETPYDYRVSAVGEDGESEPVEDSATTGEIPEPTGSAQDITLEWSTMEKVTFALTTDDQGDAEQVQGLSRPFRLYAVIWDGSDLDTGATVELEAAGLVLWSMGNADTEGTYYLRAVEHDSEGAELTMTTLPVVGDDLTLTIANGGDTKTATAIVYLV